MAEERTPENRAAAGKDVFISYASQDKAVAESACKALESAGLVCWIAPRDVVPGESFAAAIVHAIDGTRVIVLVLSEHAAASQHVLREVERASSKRHPVIAFRIDLTPMPADFEYFLNTSQWLDASTTGVKHALPKLVDAVTIALTLPSTAARTNPSASAAAKASPGRRRALVAVAGIGMAAVAYVVVDKFWLPNHRAAQNQSAAIPVAATSDKSIAVLPFSDMSEKRDQEYFADGMAEETLNQLAKIPGLRVIGRTSSFQFKHKDDDLRVIGGKLGAAHIVEGSVRRSGNRIRVTAQLVRAIDGAHEWSATYDRNIEDAIQLQSEIAVSLARALEISVTDFMSNSALAAHNSEAYDAYLRGLHALDQYTVDGFREAVNQFKRAIDLDPTFLRAYEMLGLVHQVLAAYGFVRPGPGWAQVQQDVSEILKRDPRSVMAHTLLLRVHQFYTRDWAEARREADIALALRPNDWIALFAAGDLAMGTGKLEDAERLFKTALVVDPLNADTRFELSQVLMGMGRLAEAEAEARQGLAITPTYTSGHAELGTILLAQRRFDEALRQFDQETFQGWRLTGLSQAYHALERTSASHKALDEAVRNYGENQNQAFEIACAFAYVRQSDRAFEWLDRALQQSDAYLVYFYVSWQLRSLESDPRYKAFLRKMHLPE